MECFSCTKQQETSRHIRAQQAQAILPRVQAIFKVTAAAQLRLSSVLVYRFDCPLHCNSPSLEKFQKCCDVICMVNVYIMHL